MDLPPCSQNQEGPFLPNISIFCICLVNVSQGLSHCSYRCKSVSLPLDHQLHLVDNMMVLSHAISLTCHSNTERHHIHLFTDEGTAFGRSWTVSLSLAGEGPREAVMAGWPLRIRPDQLRGAISGTRAALKWQSTLFSPVSTVELAGLGSQREEERATAHQLWLLNAARKAQNKCTRWTKSEARSLVLNHYYRYKGWTCAAQQMGGNGGQCQGSWLWSQTGWALIPSPSHRCYIDFM